MRHNATTIIFLFALAAALMGCGGADEPAEFAAACALSPSALGPFAADQPIGATLSEAEAAARAAASGYDSWIEIAATGSWDQGWQEATNALGNGIHQQLAWFDVEGEIADLYIAGEVLTFQDLRVSRSFQGKIEHSGASLFVGVEPGVAPNFEAPCTVTSVVVGTDTATDLLDLLARDSGVDDATS